MTPRGWRFAFPRGTPPEEVLAVLQRLLAARKPRRLAKKKPTK